MSPLLQLHGLNEIHSWNPFCKLAAVVVLAVVAFSDGPRIWETKQGEYIHGYRIAHNSLIR